MVKLKIMSKFTKNNNNSTFQPDMVVPTHLAVIMDGNGRWAKKRILNRVDGHRKGIERAREVIESSMEMGIKYLTLYTFSKENWNRPKIEVDLLMSLFEKHIKSEASLFIKNNIRFKVIGKVEDFSKSLQSAVRELEDKTKDNDGMTLQLALSYSGRDEILEAVKSIAREVKSGAIEIDHIDEELIEKNLYTSGVPDPDLLIRTSGESRISNFLLWQLAYTEIYITDVLWPDFTKDDLMIAIGDYQSRDRRFGLVCSEDNNEDDSDGEKVVAI